MKITKQWNVLFKNNEIRINWQQKSLNLLLALMLLPLSAAVSSAPITYDLTFETSGQSIWSTGESYTLDQTTFIGAQWQDKSVNLDLMAGAEDTELFNPLRTAWDVAYSACTGLGFSSSACINGQSARAYVPALGSRPSIRSCGRFDVWCKTVARPADYVKRAAYDTALATCKLGFSTSVCKNGQSARLPVVALGTAPPQYVEIDTRTGAEVTGTTDGRVGLELGIAIDSGSVDATVSYEATLDIPDTTSLASGAVINFNPESELSGTNSLETSFASVELSIDAIMELSGSVTAEACAVGACAAGGTSFDIQERASILAVDNGSVEILGLPPSEFGLPSELDGPPFDIDVAGLATITLDLPQPNASGGLNADGTKLTASGQDDFVDLILDVDNIVATSAGAPGLFGSETSFGTKGFEATLGFDIINVEMGPTIDLKQDFELSPTLWVSLIFDEAVEILGELVTFWQSPWDLLPDIKFLSDSTRVTPTFFLFAELLNETLLDFDLEFFIDLLQITFDFDIPLTTNDIHETFGIGNVLSQGVDLFESPNLFEKLFDLQGFNAQQGESFVINLGAPSAFSFLPAAFDLDNPIELQEISASEEVPVPGTLLLLAIGLLLIGFYAQSQSTSRRLCA